MADTTEKTTQLKAFMTFDVKNEEEMKRYLDHHMEYLIDFDSVSDITTGVHGVIAYNPESKHDGTKLQIVAELISDILDTEPSDEELDYDDKAIAMYAELHNLKEAMSDMGLL